MDPGGLTGFLLVAVLIIANGVFVATEFAYVAARRSRLRARAEAGDNGAAIALRATRDLDRYVAASQLGITMASLALGFVGEPIFARAIEPSIEELVGSFAPAAAHAVAIGFAFALVTALHIVFGELIPKTIALQYPEGTAAGVARPMRVFAIVFRPLIALLNGIGNAILRLFGIATAPIGGERTLTAQDLAFAFESSASVGILSRRELDLGRRALSLGQVRVGSVLVPRGEVATVDLSWSRERVIETIANVGRSRYPVVRSSLDDVVGLLDAKRVVLDAPAEDWREHIRPMPLLPDLTVLGRAIELLSAEDASVGLVVDEYGNIDGLVALADILGFLAGPLADERAAADPSIRRAGERTYKVSGHLRLAEAAAPPLSIKVPETKAETLGGVVVERLQRLASVGDTVTIGDRRLRVTLVEDRRVEELEVSLPESRRDGDERRAENA
ncbi:MAG TPA: hemolysin family protein [Candidatus Limnocylindria bacterium]|nr:hemolysin family protein [Candidatus Limnocylindria bacterium]